MSADQNKPKCVLWLGRFVPPLPCPACVDEIEYEDELHYNGGGPPPSYAVQCGNCGARGPFGYGARRNDHDGGISDAIKRWNEMPRRSVRPDPDTCQHAEGVWQFEGDLLCKRCQAVMPDDFPEKTTGTLKT